MVGVDDVCHIPESRAGRRTEPTVIDVCKAVSVEEAALRDHIAGEARTCVLAEQEGAGVVGKTAGGAPRRGDRREPFALRRRSTAGAVEEQSAAAGSARACRASFTERVGTGIEIAIPVSVQPCSDKREEQVGLAEPERVQRDDRIVLAGERRNIGHAGTSRRSGCHRNSNGRLCGRGEIRARDHVAGTAKLSRWSRCPWSQHHIQRWQFRWRQMVSGATFGSGLASQSGWRWRCPFCAPVTALPRVRVRSVSVIVVGR